MNAPKFFALMNVRSPSLPAGFRTGWSLAFVVTSGLVLIATLPPFVSEGARSFIMELFSGVCHQIDARSPHINQVALAVCHRCYGAYVGLPAAVLLFGSVKGAWPFSPQTAPIFLFMMTLPAIIDWGGDLAGFWHNSAASRILTGLIMGLGAGYFLAAALVDGYVESRKNRASSQNQEA